MQNSLPSGSARTTHAWSALPSRSGPRGAETEHAFYLSILIRSRPEVQMEPVLHRL